MNLIGNWICRSGVVVLTNAPAMPLEAPGQSKMSLLPSPTCGGAKLAWFMMLKISMRNWTLKFSEMRFTRLFLNTEKSRLAMPGPIRILRPALPLRLKHCGNTAGTGVGFGFAGVGIGWRLGGNWSQFAFQKAMSGAVGTTKHCVLMEFAG